jgi:hypothetical protein
MSRTAADRLIAPRVKNGERVWFSGQWGSYWYAPKAGALLTKPGKPGPLPGELLVVGRLDGGRAALKRFPKRTLLETLSFSEPGWRTMSRADGAGLYANDFGELPVSWGSGELDRYEVWRIE